MATRLVAGGDRKSIGLDASLEAAQREPPKAQRRSLLEMRMDILRVIRDGRSGLGPTQIMYKANLSWMALREQLEPLVKLGMISEQGTRRRLTYTLTERGIDALREYLRVVEQFEDLELDRPIIDRGQPSRTMV